MYTKEQLYKIRESLPKNGYERISKLLDGKSIQGIRMILTQPSRNRRGINDYVFDAALQIVEEYKQEVILQKDRLEEAIK